MFRLEGWRVRTNQPELTSQFFQRAIAGLLLFLAGRGMFTQQQTGQLPAVTSLPDEFEVFACDHHPETRFCPGMGRHYTDLTSVSRLPAATGNEGLVYGESSGKLIFIEYVFNQEDLKAGVSWPAMPLNDLPIPPIDNMHVLHFGEAGSTDGRYTVHMYFLPEEIYLNWESEPEVL